MHRPTDPVQRGGGPGKPAKPAPAKGMFLPRQQAEAGGIGQSDKRNMGDRIGVAEKKPAPMSISQCAKDKRMATIISPGQAHGN